MKRSDSAVLLALLLAALNLRPALASLGPVLESLRTDLQLSYGMAGLLTSLPVICMGVFAPLAMPLSARYGIKQTILIALLVIGCATLLRWHASLSTLLLSSLLIGACLAVLGPLLSAYIKRDFPNRNARVSGWVTTALCFGAAVAAGLSTSFSNLLGWPAALASWSLLAWLAAVQWQRAIPKREWLSGRISPLPWRQPRAWLLLLMFGMHSWVFYGLLTWLAPVYLSYGANATHAGRLLGLFALMQIVGTLAVSALPAQQRERRPALLLSGACTLSGLIAVWQAPLAAPYVWMCLLGTGTAGLFALTLILPLDYTDSADAAGSWTAMMCGGGYIIAASGPYICGLLRDMSGGYAVMFASLSSISAGVLFLCLWLTPRTTIDRH